MTWLRPLKALQSPIPEPPHPGAFGVVRKHHIHEGVDLYTPEGTPVWTVEEGLVVAVGVFTGPDAGSPWWHNTQYVMVEGRSGVVNYGEVMAADVRVGEILKPGSLVGHVKQVLRKDKGRPLSMLHIELYNHGVIEPVEWEPRMSRPRILLDPTSFLKQAYGIGV